jgi:hypothetical protein
MSKQSDRGLNLNLKTYPPNVYKKSGILMAIVSLVTIAIPSTPANAYTFTEAQLCAAELVRFAALSQEVASVACAQALVPKELSKCVLKISELTPTKAQDALVACFKVRRPLDLAGCVHDIHVKTQKPDPNAVLDYCRRSLLPLRFSECVIGLSREIDFSPPKAMRTCIAAEDFPRNLYPNFVPAAPTVPTPPPPVFVPNITPERENLNVPPKTSNPVKL